MAGNRWSRNVFECFYLVSSGKMKLCNFLFIDLQSGRATCDAFFFLRVIRFSCFGTREDNYNNNRRNENVLIHIRHRRLLTTAFV